MAAIIKNLKILKRAKAAVFKASNGSNFKFTRLLSLQTKFGRLIDFASFLIIIIIIIIIIILFLFLFLFLSADHELVHGRSQELLDRISCIFVEL